MIETARGNVDCLISGLGPAVLSLHGSLGGSDQGRLLARAALGRLPHQSIALSRPGYLDTPLSLGATPEEQADLCAGVLDALSIPSAAVVAFSGGGQCALQFALRHPGRCGALILISSCSAPLKMKRPWRSRVLEWVARHPSLTSRMARRTIRDPERAARRSIPNTLLRVRTLSDAEAGPLLREWQQSAFDRLAARLPGTRNDRENARRPFAYPVESIAAPLLVIHGTKDRAVPFAQAKALAGAVPGAQLLALEGAGHAALFTHLRQIRARVGAFLTQ
jgi:pimeloyl-ACP methyl ester carboxylesterase